MGSHPPAVNDEDLRPCEPAGRPCHHIMPLAQPRSMTHHLTEPRRRVDRLAGLWADTAWPVLAGALTATGLIGAWRAYGLIAAALIFIGLWTFAATLTYGICSESGISPERTVRLSFAGTLLVVVLMGLLELFPVGGWLAAAVVAITSPVVTTWLVRRLAARCRGLEASGCRGTSRPAGHGPDVRSDRVRAGRRPLVRAGAHVTRRVVSGRSGDELPDHRGRTTRRKYGR